MSEPVEPILRLAAAPPDGQPSIEGRVALKVSGEALTLDISAPAGPANLTALLPIFRGLTDAIVARGAARSEAAGSAISCRAGCGVCCRQPVPISEPEAHALAAVVEAMPEPRRAEIRARFAAAEQRLEAAGLQARLGDWRQAIEEEGRVASALDYLGLRIACPFLEAESCSVYADRPLVCREYLVTSPAEHCADPGPETIARVDMPARPSKALVRLGRRDTAEGWLLLVHALSFAAQHADAPAKDPAPAVVQAVFGAIAGAGGDGAP